jgi:hypothetical protein
MSHFYAHSPPLRADDNPPDIIDDRPFDEHDRPTSLKGLVEWSRVQSLWNESDSDASGDEDPVQPQLDELLNADSFKPRGIMRPPRTPHFLGTLTWLREASSQRISVNMGTPQNLGRWGFRCRRRRRRERERRGRGRGRLRPPKDRVLLCKALGREPKWLYYYQ